MRHLNLGRMLGSTRLATVALVLGLAGCGGQVADQPEFVGSWAENGEELITCNGTAQPPNAIMDTFTINHGVDAPLTVILTNPSCVLRLDADGSTATVRPGQTCS